MSTAARKMLNRLGLGSACAVCCVVPMLVVIGFVSAAAFVTGGVVVAAGAAVVATTFAVMTGRAGRVPPSVRLWLFAAGGAGAFAGLWGAASQRSGASLVVVVSVAALAVAALLALDEAHRMTPPQH